MKKCLFCGMPATKEIVHGPDDYKLENVRTPVCGNCADVYGAGQASPDAAIVMMGEEPTPDDYEN